MENKPFVNSLNKICKNIYGVCISYAVLVGAVTAILFIIGLIVGGGDGGTGESMAVAGDNIMQSAMVVAAIGALFGMVTFYLEKDHQLTTDTKHDDDE